MRERLFHRVRRAALIQACYLGLPFLPRADGRLLALDELTRAVPPGGTRYMGVSEVRVDRILGSEDRSSDFSCNYLPLKLSMAKRWSTVRDLMLGPGLFETLKLIEFGGRYFVRDGNHRVSVARAHRRVFLDAEVVRWECPVPLPMGMAPSHIPQFRAKARFEERTGFYSSVPDAHLGKAKPETWDWLADYLTGMLRDRWIERCGEEPEPEEINSWWLTDLYRPTRQIIHRLALPVLFPDATDLDIYAAFTRFDEDTGRLLSLNESFSVFMEYYEKRRLPARLYRRLVRRISRILGGARREKDDFYRMTRLRILRPDARIPDGRGDWYRFLRYQVFSYHADYLQALTGERPEFDTMVTDWYDRLLAPALALHRERSFDQPFPVFYKRWMTFWYRLRDEEIRRTGKSRTDDLRASLEIYLARNPDAGAVRGSA